MSARYDAVIVGGGHNGLVAAFYLAGGGLRTLVLERRDIVGGACVTEEFAPGFRASPGAYVLSMLRDAIWHDMRLRERGLHVDQAGPSLNVFPDGQTFVLHGDRARSVDAHPAALLARRPCVPGVRGDARTDRLRADAGVRLDGARPAGAEPADLPGLLRLGRLAFRHRHDLQEASFLFTTSAKQYLDEHFDDDMVKSALGWESISNTLAGPSTPGTAYGLLHEAASGGSGGGVGWGFVRGGMGTVTGLMADAAREAGAEIRTGAEVEQVRIAGGRATGVVLVGGEEVEAVRVLSNADPKRTFLGLVGRDRLPSGFVGSLGAYRCEGASMKINLAVAELPRVRGVDGDGGGRAALPPWVDPDLEAARRPGRRPGVGAGRHPGRGRACGALHPHRARSVARAGGLRTSSRSASGRSPIRFVTRPGTTSRRTWPTAWSRTWGTFVPNLPGSILHREVLTPLDLERRLSLTGGHHLHGDMSPDQLLFLRPVRGYADYRTPVDRLYLCGAGTHPGGGVTGANGRNCAREVLHDVKGTG